MDPTAEPVFVFDGDCAFCTTCARFIERRIRPAARVVAWQHTDIDALELTEQQCEESVWWINPAGAHPRARRAAGPDAIGHLLLKANPFWRLSGQILLLRPIRLVSWPVYRLVARNRDKMPGGTPACAVPRG